MGCSCWGSEDSEQAESLFPLQIYEHAEYISPLGPKMGVRLPAPKLVGKTAHKILEEVWDLLQGYRSYQFPITVYGMAGAGKTAIMMNFYNQLLEAEGTGFDNFIFMSVRRYSEDEDENIRRWQDSLAHALNVELPVVEQDMRERAEILRKVLKSVGNFLIIMDDVSIGFHPGDVISSWHFPNKLVLVSRFRQAGRSPGHFVWVDLLSEKEALKLFVEKVNTELTPKMQDLIDDIVKECACLPLIIVAVAGALRGKEDIFWREALHKLRYSAKGMMDTQGTMYKSLKFDWDQLPSQIWKERFLYCVLYPKHWGILRKELTDYWPMVWMVYKPWLGQNNVFDPQPDSSFKNVGVDFEDCHEWGEGIKMHRLYRDFALLTANQRFMSKCGQKLKELPDGSEWGENLEGASFMCNNITSIAVSPRCPQLRTLFLNQNPDLCSIARSFFDHMLGLKILDMRDNARLKSLPNSLSSLVFLQALRMSRCSSLKKVPSLAKLTQMEILEFDDTAIEELPHGIDVYFKLGVTKLRVLKLHSLRLRKPIPNWFLSSLHLLPQLDLQM